MGIFPCVYERRGLVNATSGARKQKSTRFPDFIIYIEFFAHLLYDYNLVTFDDVCYGRCKAILEGHKKLNIKAIETNRRSFNGNSRRTYKSSNR